MKDTRKCNCVWHASGCGCTAEDASARPLDKRFLREGRSPNKALYTDRQQSCMHGCNISCTSQMQPRSLQQTPRNTYTNIYIHSMHWCQTWSSRYRENGWWKIMQITLNATCSADCLTERSNLNGLIMKAMAYSIMLRSAPPLSRTDNEPAVGLWDMRGPPALHTRV